MSQFKLKPTELFIFPNECVNIQLQSCSKSVTLIDISLAPKKFTDCSVADSDLSSFVLNKQKIALNPDQNESFQLNFIPRSQKTLYFPVKIILKSKEGTFQINVLGINSQSKIIQYNNGVLNTGTDPVFVKNTSTQEAFILLPHNFYQLQQTCKLVYGPVIVKDLVKKYQLFYQSTKMKLDPLDVLTERMNFLEYSPQQQGPQVGSNVYESIKYQDESQLKANMEQQHHIPQNMNTISEAQVTLQQNKTMDAKTMQIQDGDVDTFAKVMKQEIAAQKQIVEQKIAQNKPAEAKPIEVIKVTPFVYNNNLIPPTQQVTKITQPEEAAKQTEQLNNTQQQAREIQPTQQKINEIQTQEQVQILVEPQNPEVQRITDKYLSQEPSDHDENPQSNNEITNIMTQIPDFVPSYQNKSQEYASLMQQHQALDYEIAHGLYPSNIQISNEYKNNLTYNTQITQPTLQQGGQYNDSTNKESVENYDSEEENIEFNIPDNAPPELIAEYQRELEEYKYLMKSKKVQSTDTMKSRYQDEPYTNVLYEQDIIPEFQSVTVQYVDRMVQHTSQSKKYLTKCQTDDVTMVSGNQQLNYWRIYDSEFSLNQKAEYQKLGDESVEVGIWLIGGQLTIQNQAHLDSFVQEFQKTQMKKFKDEYENVHEEVLFDHVADSIEKLSTLYYQIQLVTPIKEFSNFKIQLKTDVPLIDKLSPGQLMTINMEIGVVISDVDSKNLPQIPKVFENLHMRIFGLRTDREYTSDELQALPTFTYEDQFENETIEAVDLKVKFGQNLEVERAIGKPNAVFKNVEGLNSRASLVEKAKCLNVEHLNYLQLLPDVQVNNVNDVGELFIQKESEAQNIISQVKKQQDLKESAKKMTKVQNSGLKQEFSPGPLRSSTNKLYIQNTQDKNDNKEIIKQYPVNFRHKAMQYKNINVQKLCIQIYPTNLPEIPELNRLLEYQSQLSQQIPVISQVFECKFIDRDQKKLSQLIVDTNALFSSNDYNAANLQVRFQIPKTLRQQLYKLMINEPNLRLPMQIEQKFELSIATYQSNKSYLWTQPIMFMAKLCINETVRHPRTRNILVENRLLGINMKNINGYVDQLFTDQFQVTIKPCYINDQQEQSVIIYNGSGKPIIGFVQNVLKPFRVVSTFQIPANQNYNLKVGFSGYQIGQFQSEFRIQWADVNELTQKAVEQRDQQKQKLTMRSITIKISGTCVGIPLMVQQNNKQSHDILVSKYQQTSFLQLENISSNNIKYSFKGKENVIAIPQEGQIEAHTIGQIRILWKDVDLARIGSGEEVRLNAEVGGRKVCCFQGICRVAE
ncbi:Conserved_hypothetical protein [Hexamita inflata]|uniref:Uncharacterized protein n=1 Tax=Hexamita inflata TaxID=28002 RepID=A0AA86P246_9EUKA|nr:Conserved hypothetical protein [Hexamita inflata]